MDITVVSTDAYYQKFGLNDYTRSFDCEVICATAEDPDTGEKSLVLLIHDVEKKVVISLEVAPVLQAVSFQTAKENFRKG